MRIRQIALPVIVFTATACGGTSVAPEAAGRTLPSTTLDLPVLPSIQSFTASPDSITAGETSTLAATYSNGTGSIDQAENFFCAEKSTNVPASKYK